MEKTNPITVEVIRNALLTAALEMKAVVVRAAYSPLWKESGDLSCGLLDGRGDLIAQSMGDIPVHSIAMPASLRGALGRIPPEEIREGDVLFHNDPTAGNLHLQDFFMGTPVFVEGKIAAWSAVRGHWPDVGGVSPGSYGPTVDLYGGGLRIPPRKIYREGEINRDLLEVMLANMRNPRERYGDLQAQYAGVLTGARRLAEIFQRYGAETVQASMEEILNHSEARMRLQIGRLPAGTWEFVDYCDGDAVRAEPLKIQVAVTVSGTDIRVDFTGSSVQAGGMNTYFTATVAATCYAVKCLMDPEEPTANSGSFRPITVVAPPGSFLNPDFPAPFCEGNHETSIRITDAIVGAVSKVAPERAVAAGSGSAGVFIVGGRDTRSGPPGKEYVFYECHGSGQGASRDGDGQNTVRILGNTGCTPVESVEIEYPLLVEKCEIVPDSGGAGKWRGGCTFRRVYRLLADSAVVSIMAERNKFRPYGLYGGRPGAPARFVLHPGSPQEKDLFSKSVVQMHKGDRILFQPAGGGGWGDPRERDIEFVSRDLRKGYVSPESARADYGWNPEGKDRKA